MNLKEQMAYGRLNRLQRRQSSQQQPIAFTALPLRYEDARPIAQLPQGGEIDIEPLSNASVPPEGLTVIQQGQRAIGLWMPRG